MRHKTLKPCALFHTIALSFTLASISTWQVLRANFRKTETKMNYNAPLLEMERLTEKLRRMEEGIAQIAAIIQRLTIEDPQVAAITRLVQTAKKPSYKEQTVNPRGNTSKDQGGIIYAYVNEDEVAALATARGQNMNQFVLDLEILVYKDSSAERSEPLNKRRDQAKVDFIRECFFKYYSVPEAFRKQLWSDRALCLNNRAYNTRKAEEKKAEEEKRLWS